jgi:hypothetical protein
MRGDRDVRSLPTANQLIDQADARIAELKADLRLTTDEDKNWDGFQSAVHDIAAKRIDEWNNLLKQPTAASSETPAVTGEAVSNPQGNGTPNTNANAETQNPPNGTTTGHAVTQNAPAEVQALRNEADRLSRRADDLKKLADAAQPLFSSLDDPQRRLLMVFIRSYEADAQRMETAITAYAAGTPRQSP